MVASAINNYCVLLSTIIAYINSWPLYAFHRFPTISTFIMPSKWVSLSGLQSVMTIYCKLTNTLMFIRTSYSCLFHW